MSRIFHPLLYLLACATRQELARQVQYLKIENEVLRKRLPKRIVVRPDERRRLLKAGRGLGKAIGRLITIVHPATFLRWLKEDETPRSRKKPTSRKPGRPRTPEEVRKLIIRIATDTGWGYTRILGELRKLSIRLSRQTVKNILKEHGLEPGPTRDAGTWDEFLKMHAASLWQCDFFSKRIWTVKGLRQCFVLVFINVATRKVFATPCSFKPNAKWMKAQAEAFVAHTQAEKIPANLVTHDRDGMFVRDFKQALRAAGLRSRALSPQSPNLQAYVERFVQTIQQECLDHFLVLGQKHFDHLIAEFLEHYHAERPHQGLGNLPVAGLPPPASGEVRCRTRLGGLLRHYERRAA